MSSVSSKSGSSGQEDAVRQARDDYRKKEAELLKKHNREIRALNQKYVGELDRKDQVYSGSMKDARTRSQEALNNRDARYKKEMDDLRKMHTQQLEKLMSDNNQRLEAQRDASRLEIKQTNLGKDDRTKSLHDQYSRQLATESEKFANQIEEVREKQRESMLRERDSVEREHRKEKEAMRDTYNDNNLELKGNYNELRENTSQRLRSQEIRHMQDKMRMQSAHMDNIRRAEESHNTIQDISREGFQESVKDVRSKMARAREDDMRRQNELQGDFKSNVNDRIENQVNRLERDLSKERNKTVIQKTQANQQAQREINNIRDAYQDKFDYLENARLETLRQSNEINAQNIHKVTGEADKQMVESGKYYRGQMEMENFRNRQALNSTKSEFELRNEYQKEMADNRISNIREKSLNNELQLRENFKSNVEVLRQSNDEEKKDLRITLHKEKEETVQLIKEQSQKQEVEHQRKTQELVNKYEKRISELNDQFIREKRLRENREKQLIKDVQRQHHTEKEALQAKYEAQSQQARLSHERELKDVGRRSQEKLDEVLTSMKKT